MFNIQQQPQVPAGTAAVDFVVFVQGSAITINGEQFDFSFMERGSYLPHDAIDSPWFFPQDVTCDDSGVINVKLYVPVADPSQPLPTLEGKKYGTVIENHIPAFEPPAVEEVPDAAGQN